MKYSRRSIVHIDPQLLTVDPTIQRPLDEVRVKREAARFDPDSMGAITISLREDGSRVILDGQHRVEFARRSGFQGKVTAIQYEGLSYADEAGLFLTLNETRQVQAIDKYRARIANGEKDALGIQQILDRHGWHVSSTQSSWHLSAIAALEKVYNGSGVRTVGGDFLADTTMSVISRAWEGRVLSAHATILSSLGKFLGWYGNEVDQARLVTILSQMTPARLLADIKALKDAEHTDMANTGAKILTNLYNTNRRKNRLESWVRR